MKCHRNSDGNVDAHHADLDLVGKLACRISIACENRGAVAGFVLVDPLRGGRIPLSAGDRKNRPEYLFLVDLHVGGHVVEERTSDEIPIFIALQLELASASQASTYAFTFSKCCLATSGAISALRLALGPTLIARTFGSSLAVSVSV